MIDELASDPDAFGRSWPGIPDDERCRTCGQPDNCGECNHQMLSAADVLTLGGTTND